MPGNIDFFLLIFFSQIINDCFQIRQQKIDGMRTASIAETAAALIPTDNGIVFSQLFIVLLHQRPVRTTRAAVDDQQNRIAGIGLIVMIICRT